MEGRVFVFFFVICVVYVLRKVVLKVRGLEFWIFGVVGVMRRVSSLVVW